MKKDIHPNSRKVIFEDSASGKKFVSLSTVKTKDKVVYEGEEYPLVSIAVSSASHPFYVGSGDVVDSEGHIDKFKKRYEMANRNSIEAFNKDRKAKQEKIAAGNKKKR